MIGFLLFIRVKDIPKPEPDRPSNIWKSARPPSTKTSGISSSNTALDKLSDDDYQATKLELQKELAQVMAETDRIKAELDAQSGVAPQPVAVGKEERVPVVRRELSKRR